MMPASSGVGLVASPAQCFRVVLRDQRGILWAPIVVAVNQEHAEGRAMVIYSKFGQYTLVNSERMHSSDEGHAQERWPRRIDRRRTV